MWGYLIVVRFSIVWARLSCPEFKSTHAKISINDLKAMGKEDIIECLSFFGREELDTQEGKYIWDALTSFHGSVPEIPDYRIKQLGWVLTSIPTEDLANFTMNDVDTIASLGQFRNLSQEQLEMLAERVSEDWANKGPKQYTHYDLTTLGHILCGFNQSTIEEIHGDSYKEAAGSLALIHGCPTEPLEALARLAQTAEAYGPPKTWSSTQLKNIGCVINGLDFHGLNAIPATGFESITPDIIPCITVDTIKALTASQLSHLTPSAIAALSTQQRSQFSKEQRKSIEAAFEGDESRQSTAFRQISSNLIMFGCIYLLHCKF